MLRVREDIRDVDNNGLEDVSTRAGKSVGRLRGFASWSKRDMEYALPGDWLSDLREDVNDASLVGIVGTKSVRRRPTYPLAQPAGVLGILPRI